MHRWARMGLFTDSLLLLRCLPLGFDAPSAQRIGTDFSQAEGALQSEKSVEICGICGRQISAQCAKEQPECIYSPTDRTDKHRYHSGVLLSKTRISPMRTDGSFHGFFTLAPLPTAWFLMRRRRNGSPRIFRMRKVRCGAKNLWKSAGSVGNN